MNKKVVVLFSLLMALFSLSFAANLESLKIGYVDFQVLTENTTKWKSLQEDYKNDFDFYQNKISKMEEEFKNFQATNPSQQELQRRAQDLQVKVNQYQSTIQEEYGNKTNKLLQEIRDIAAQYGKENGFDIVLYDQGVIYASEKIDITEKVIEYVNNK
ncbi:OmpH family outer membrane protein [Oceanotoga sp. DSM 15011]|uniref:Periplasmic chaperone for outer membrane proteins Skp n=1 Tax=Oceanotoga teriensis TaxID=515440 RepID=A0AA45C6B3_9BACT|nr:MULTISPECIES: OmpH family outer membrane protein [Oceanotoga]PWJ91217.1 periplasmic chaperone for outer membrane proteins Skp [Oceanotoga teriensis]UYO99692.1 OmpH family outer membrane protein [Oceanotoga sp. DSM 15011]